MLYGAIFAGKQGRESGAPAVEPYTTTGSVVHTGKGKEQGSVCLPTVTVACWLPSTGAAVTSWFRRSSGEWRMAAARRWFVSAAGRAADGKQGTEEEGRVTSGTGEKGRQRRGRIGAYFVAGVAVEGRDHAGEMAACPSHQPWGRILTRGASRLIRQENALAGLTNRWHRWVNSLQLYGLGGTW
jgi:hypothetical protein